MTKNAEVRAFIWFGATVCLVMVAMSVVGCGRDGYVVVKEAKTPHRAYDLPTFGTNVAEAPRPPLPIIPIAEPDTVAVPELIPNPLAVRPKRAPKIGAGWGWLSVSFADRTGDRVSKFDEGSVRDCALFKKAGEAAGQEAVLYAHLLVPGRELRMALDVVLFEGRVPLLDLSRLTMPVSPASWTLRPVIKARSFVEARDSFTDAEGPPMWAMDSVLGAQKLDRSCRADASVKRAGGAPSIEMSLSCGAIEGDAVTDAIQSLAVTVNCAARESTRLPYFAGEKR